VVPQPPDQELDAGGARDADLASQDLGRDLVALGQLARQPERRDVGRRHDGAEVLRGGNGLAERHPRWREQPDRDLRRDRSALEEDRRAERCHEHGPGAGDPRGDAGHHRAGGPVRGSQRVVEPSLDVEVDAQPVGELPEYGVERMDAVLPELVRRQSVRGTAVGQDVVVEHDQDVVGGAPDVHLDPCGAGRRGGREALRRVLPVSGRRASAARSPMADENRGAGEELALHPGCVPTSGAGPLHRCWRAREQPESRTGRTRPPAMRRRERPRRALASLGGRLGIIGG
jgi:hypothetical protein